ncbi:DUF3085 domain-containing protein [Geopseudomonas aromaticivorans]
MAILSFPLAEVRRLAEHADQCKEHAPTFSQHYDRAFWKNPAADLSNEQVYVNKGEHLDLSKIPAGLWLVKDQGIYLISNGSPRLQAEGSDSSVVVHAKGYNPECDEDWYDAARSAVGGDDFVEFIPLEWIEHAEKAGKTALEIVMTETEMALKE